MKSQEFSIRSRVKSFRFAMDGIASFFYREHNAWVHFAATVAVIALTVWVKVTQTELLALIFAIAFVWVAEMLNTCIERIMDFVSVQQHPEVKFIKDLAAGAVLVAAITALVVGAVVFIPKFF
jgi:diacylglycerol kinase (ATP)